MTDLISYAGFIKHVCDELEKRINNGLRPLNLTMVQLTALLHLYKREGGCMSLKELEGELHVAQSTAAGIAKRLEEKGFIESSSSTEDRRIKLLCLSEKGRELCLNAEARMAEAQNELLSCLTETEKLLFLSILKKLKQSLN